jgi:2-oxoglutarate ferredoxin oxidoreductase subunit beta
MDNEIYGLTKGQPSPTSPIGMEKKSAPYGSIESPLNPILMTLSYNASFVARGFSAKPRELVELIKMAIMHKGFSFLQILSPCVTFNDTYEHFKQVTLPLPADHDVTDRAKAMALALDEHNIYLGVFYNVERPSFVTNVRAVQAKAAAASPFDLQKLIARYKT